MYWFVECFRKYAVFSGRSRRVEYWYFLLFCGLLGIVEGPVEDLFEGLFEAGFLVDIIGILFTVAVIIPEMAVTTRRFHDIDKSGWWGMLHFIPIIGTVVVLIWMLKPGTSGPNRFGNDPRDDDFVNKQSLDVDTER